MCLLCGGQGFKLKKILFIFLLSISIVAPAFGLEANEILIVANSKCADSVELAAYTKISFAKRAKAEGISTPKLHTFVSNRVTKYEGNPSKAFNAMIKAMKETLDRIYLKHRDVFSQPAKKPSSTFLFVPDYHSASIVAASTGTPLYQLTAGPKDLGGERVQINQGPLNDYREKLEEVVDRL